MRDLIRVTRAERDAYRLAVSLFFGALLGTNLAALDAMRLSNYIAVVAALAALVMGFQLIGAARSRIYGLWQLSLIAAIIAILWRRRDALLTGVPEPAVDRLFATLGVWFAAILIIELTPLTKEGPR